MAINANETIELESQPLNYEKKDENTSAFTYNKNNTDKEKITPIGLTKEELMKYASDPFWCRLRKILFSLFWLLWIAMFIGAFLIIQYAPNCPATSKLKWYQKNSVGYLDMELFSNNLTNLIEKMDTFARVFPVRTYIFPSLFDTKDLAINDHFLINNKYGDFNQLNKVITSLKIKHEVNVIMDFDIQVTSFDHKWYKKFIKKEDKYANYYLKLKSNSSNNNYSTKILDNGEYLVIKNNLPVLNLLNEDLKDEFRRIFQFWIRKGLKGFRILNLPFLLYDLDKGILTENINLNINLINEWNLEIKKLTSDGVLFLQFDKQNNLLLSNYLNNVTILPKLTDIIENDYLTNINENNIDPTMVKNELENYFKLFNLNNNDKNETYLWTGWVVDKKSNSQRSNKFICLSNIIGYLAPLGVPITRLSSDLINFNASFKSFEINSIPDKIDSTNIYVKLANLRNIFDEAIILGRTSFPNVTSDIFTFMKFNEKHGILVISNLKQNLDNNFSELILKLGNEFPKSGEVILTCSSDKIHYIGENIRLDHPIYLKKDETFIVKFSFKKNVFY